MMFTITPLRFFYISCITLISSVYLYCALPPLSAQDFDNFLKSLTEEDLAAMMADLEKMSPQELAELERVGREALSQMGIDPDTLQQGPPPGAPRPIAPSSSPVQTKQPGPTQPAKPKEAPAYPPAKIGRMLHSLARTLDALLQKYHTYPALRTRMAPIIHDIVNIIGYVRVLNTPVHQERLAAKSHISITDPLIHLEQALSHFQTHIKPQKPMPDEQDPYLILNVGTSASMQEIEQAYQRALIPLESEHITQRIRDAQGSDKEIARALKAADLQRHIINQAYQQLKNPVIRQQLDLEQAKRLEGTIDTSTASALAHCIQAISQALGPDDLLRKLAEYMKEYAPEKAALVKEQQDHEAARLKEHKEFLSIKPQLTRGTFEPQYKPISESAGLTAAGRGAASAPSLAGKAPAQRSGPSTDLLGPSAPGGKPGSKAPSAPSSKKPGEKPAEKAEDAQKKPETKSGEKAKTPDAKIEDPAGSLMLGLQKMDKVFAKAPYASWADRADNPLPAQELVDFIKDAELNQLVPAAEKYKKNITDASKEVRAQSTFFVESMMQRYARPLQKLKDVVESQKKRAAQGPISGGLAQLDSLITPLYKHLDACAKAVLQTTIKDIAGKQQPEPSSTRAPEPAAKARAKASSGQMAMPEPQEIPEAVPAPEEQNGILDLAITIQQELALLGRKITNNQNDVATLIGDLNANTDILARRLGHASEAEIRQVGVVLNPLLTRVLPEIQTLPFGEQQEPLINHLQSIQRLLTPAYTL